MDKISQWIYEFTGFTPDVQSKIFTSILVIFVLWFLRVLLMRVVWRRTEDIPVRYRWQKTSSYVVVFLGILFVSRVWFEGVQSLATYLGLLSAGIAIALKDLVASLAGWLFIISRRPFSVGDRVQIGPYTGDIIDIRPFKFTLIEIGNWVDADQSTGRIMDLPNSMVINDMVASYTRGFQFIWHEIPILVTFESNWKKAKEILTEISGKHAEHLSTAAERQIKDASRRFMISYGTLAPEVYTTVKDSGVLLTIRYLIEPRRRRGSEQAIWEDILNEFAQCNDIDFAYPTRRFYNNALEGKEEARAKVV